MSPCPGKLQNPVDFAGDIKNIKGDLRPGSLTFVSGASWEEGRSVCGTGRHFLPHPSSSHYKHQMCSPVPSAGRGCLLHDPTISAATGDRGGEAGGDAIVGSDLLWADYILQGN